MQNRYKCEECGKELLHKRKPGKKFPSKITCDCGGVMYRVFGNVDTSVAKGKYGSSDNGFNRFDAAGHPSKHVPLDWVHGEEGRTDEFIDGRR
jgi:hypothetical protein